MNTETTIPAKILLVDDIRLNLDYLEELLEDMENMECVSLISGQEALDYIEKEEFALGILDIQMPDIDGFETLSRIRKSIKNPNMPIIFVSGVYSEEQYIIKGIKLGAVDFMPKPFNNEVLYGKVKAFLDMYRNRKKLDILIDELEKTNDKLSFSEERFRKISMVAHDGIVVTNHEGIIHFWNESAQRIFGYTSGEIVGKNIGTLFSGDKYHNDLPDSLKEIYKNHKSSDGMTAQYTAVHKEQYEFTIELSLSGFISGGSFNTVCIVRDISRRLRIQNELLKAKEAREANKIMKQFMDNMNHELRTPLNAIIGISKNLLKFNRDNLSPKQLESLEIISSSGGRLNDLVEKLFEFRDKKEIETEELNLVTYCKDLEKNIKKLIDKKNITCEYSVDKSVPEKIYIDKHKLSIILNSLLDNAVKFTSEGKISLCFTSEENRLITTITDTGIGMSKKEQKEVFKKFIQLDGSIDRKHSGTGLGLALVRKLLKQLDGDISLESEPGKGTVVHFKIPLKPNKSTQ